MELTLAELYRVFGKKFEGKNAFIKGICTDTRKLKKGDVFFALIGVTDGHKYAARAFENGAAALVVEKYAEGVEISKQIMVKDTTDALLELAKYYFKKFKIKAAAVTGSNGKTTTKELLAVMLSEKYTVLKNEKSFNNNIGLPATVFNLSKKHEAAVFEIGMNHKGEIGRLVSAVKLDAAIITNIGRAHIGFFKDGTKGIASAKSEIFQGIKNGGTAVLNNDDAFAGILRGKAKDRGLKIRTFGMDGGADIYVIGYEMKDGWTVFEVNGIKGRLKMRLSGLHNLYNAASAIALAKAFGVSDIQIKRALAKFKMEGFMRFEEIELKNNVKLINDCYNANPDSFAASIETLKELGAKDLTVVMGDMLELGKNAAKFHEETGRKFAELDIKNFLIYGKNARYVKKGYGKPAFIFTDREKLKAKLKNVVKNGSVVFIKGSRGNKLEEIAKVLEAG
jgi:UDP-N-acetylmuramoyl-tripeptide--D-alanyl-D-alanine ligase